MKKVNFLTFDVKLKLNMAKEKIEVEEKSITSSEGKTYKEKIIQYFEEQVQIRKEELQIFETSLVDSELSESFKTQKIIANTKYWDAVNNLRLLKLL